MRVIDMENIIGNMRDEMKFVLRCEEVFRDKLSYVVANILENRPARPIVCITGPSGSGKTTTAMRLRAYIENLGVKVCLVSMDNFFLPRDARPSEVGDDWESPYCVDTPRLVHAIDCLLQGDTVEIPKFNFKTGTNEETFLMQGDRDAVVIAEGIHMLNPLLWDHLSDRATGVYVAPRTRVLTDEDRIVRPEQIRVARRMIRDYQNRGHSLRDTILRAESVDLGEEKYIQPFKSNAALHIDTFHDYELCILARYLREIPHFYEDFDEDFLHEHHLTNLFHLLQSIPGLQTPYVPRDSVIREFIGGSCFAY